MLFDRSNAAKTLISGDDVSTSNLMPSTGLTLNGSYFRRIKVSTQHVDTDVKRLFTGKSTCV